MAWEPSDAQKATGKTIWQIWRKMGYNEYATAGMLGFITRESQLNPGITEYGGGGGYGLVQWTPKYKLYEQAAKLGMSNAEAETIQGQATIIGEGDKTGQWIDYYSPIVYVDGAVQPLTVTAFKKADSIKFALANFQAHFGRGAVRTLHMAERTEYANYWYKAFTGLNPSGGSGSTKAKTKQTLIALDTFLPKYRRIQA
jgi:hypothetical protein